LEKAQERFKKALSISPEFARAWTGLSAAIAALIPIDDLSGRAKSPSERSRMMETLRDSSEQALRYAPNDPETLIRVGTYYSFAGDRKRGWEYFDRARFIEPDHWLVRARLASVLVTLGRIDEAIATNQRQIRRDPLNMAVRSSQVTYLVWGGDFQAARTELTLIYDLMPWLAEHSQYLKSQDLRVRILSGEFEAAEISLESMAHTTERLQLLAINYYALGRPVQADEALQLLLGSASDGRDAYRIAEVLAFRGENRAALERLQGIDFGEDCQAKFLAARIYYSPFLAMLDGDPGWADYRSGVLEMNRACLQGFEVDSA
jgi:tetratricopeptide (TPR) repeat protein